MNFEDNGFVSVFDKIKETTNSPVNVSTNNDNSRSVFDELKKTTNSPVNVSTNNDNSCVFDELKKSTSAIISTKNNNSLPSTADASQNRYTPQQPTNIVMEERTHDQDPPTKQFFVDNKKFKLITIPPLGSTRVGPAINSDPTCCCIGPWGICFCSKLKFGPRYNAIEVSYDEKSGKLVKVGNCSCSQTMSVDWGNMNEKTSVSLLRCGCMPCCTIDSEKFDLLSDGTIGVRELHELVLGSYDNINIQLVKQGTDHRFIFKELLH